MASYQVVQKCSLWANDNAYGPERKPAATGERCTPRIVLRQPPMTGRPVRLDAVLHLDVAVDTFGTLKLRSVTVRLGGRELYTGETAPAPGAVALDPATLSDGLRDLTVIATDERGVKAQCTVALEVEH